MPLNKSLLRKIPLKVYIQNFWSNVKFTQNDSTMHKQYSHNICTSQNLVTHMFELRLLAEYQHTCILFFNYHNIT